jgi:HEPN domain-containing protein
MNNPQEEARRWLAQAQNDLAFARVGLSEGYPAQTCFMAQQAAEKAVKAVRYGRGDRIVLGHSVWDQLRVLGSDVKGLAKLAEAAKELDQLCVPSRYPNGLPAGAPFEVITAAQAKSAVAAAESIVTEVERIIARRRASKRKRRS